MSTMASQITSITIVYSTVYSGADQTKKHQSLASLAFVWGIHRWPMNSPRKRPVMRKMFPFDDVIMRTHLGHYSPCGTLYWRCLQTDNIAASSDPPRPPHTDLEQTERYTLRPINLFKRIFFNENILISIKISLKFVLLAEVTSATRFCCPMITSSHGNSSRVTDPLIRKSQVSGEFPSQRANIAEFYIVFDISLNKQLNKQLPVIWNAIMLICCHCNTMFHCSYIIIHVEVTLSHVVGTCDRVNRWFRCRSKNSSKLRVTGLCEGNPPVDSHHKGPVTRKMLPIDDVIMGWEWNLPATKHAKRESFA